MTIYLVDIEQTTHTCPADPAPHVVDTWRTIVAVTDGGPCHNPITLHRNDDDTTVVITCGRRLPAEQQCSACRTVVVEHTVTTRDSGPYVHSRIRVSSGLAANPCTVCHLPLAAILADWGAHLLCCSPTQAAA